MEGDIEQRDLLMQLLVVYYSRTGMTRKVAQVISSSLGCDVEEIIDLKNTGKDAFQRKLTEIGKVQKNPALYEVVFIGTSTLNNTISSAIRTYIHTNKERLRKVAFFCAGGVEDIVFKEMESLCGKHPITTLALRKEDMNKRKYVAKAEEFTTDVPASIISDILRKIDSTKTEASLNDLLELRREVECISELVKKIRDSIERKRELEDDLLIAYDSVNLSINELDKKERDCLC